MNIIAQVGFGRGRFRDVGGEGDAHPYLLPPLGLTGDEVIVFEGAELRSQLTFGWFLENVICPEKPDICDPFYQSLHDQELLKFLSGELDV